MKNVIVCKMKMQKVIYPGPHTGTIWQIEASVALQLTPKGKERNGIRNASKVLAKNSNDDIKTGKC